MLSYADSMIIISCRIKSLIKEKENCQSSFKFGLQVIALDSFLGVSLKIS